MKLRFDCDVCREAFVDSEGAPDRELFLADVQDVNDDGVYKVTCPRGHFRRYVFANPKHEVLFDAAALALIDGYYREAVSTFACSLERALEFFTRWAARLTQIPIGEFEKAWKFSSKHSERQFGMFLFAHLAFAKRGPPLSKSDYERLASQRNEVVHAGAIVDRATAATFGSTVFRLIAELNSTLHDEAGPQFSKAIFGEWEEVVLAEHGTTLALEPLFLLGAKRNDSFEERLEDFESRNIWVRHSAKAEKA